MPCFRPITCFKPLAGGGPVSFTEVKDSREIQIKCGQCIGCRIMKRDMWAVRCYAESKTHDANCFVTLTYDEEHLPKYGSLNYRDFQLFMKRFRKKCGPVRFFMSGEYGEQKQRPHYHALFFGHDFPDKFRANSVYSSAGPLYRSPTLDALWGKGFATIGEVTFASARYTAAYICKKHSDDEKYRFVDRETGEFVYVEKEFARMSLRPGIGAAWLEMYWRDIYRTGHRAVVINGRKHKAPTYFDARMKETMPVMMEDYLTEQELEVQRYALDNTPARLAQREQVALAKEKFYKEK